MKHPFRAEQDLNGGVLILVLMVTFVLTVLALSSAGIMRAGLGVSSLQRDQLLLRREAVSIAHAAAAVVLCDTNGWDAIGERWAGGDRSREEALPLALSDASSRICINRADEKLLGLLMRHAGLSDRDAKRVVDSTLDWIDADSDARELGSEDADYQARDLIYRCADAPLRSPDEWLLVSGVDVDLLERLRPLLTVHGEGLLNINTASGPVLNLFGRSVARDVRSVDLLVGRLLAARERGVVFSSLSADAIATELNRFDALSPGERIVLTAMIPGLCVESDVFSGVAVVSAPNGRAHYQVTFAFSRQRSAFVAWCEGPAREAR